MSDWRPIETAPRDGTWVMLSGGETTEGDYPDELGEERKRPVIAKWERDLDDRFIDDGWVFCYWDGDWRDGYLHPTHWRPLPNPPEDT